MRKEKLRWIFLTTVLLVPGGAFAVVNGELPTCTTTLCDGSVARCNEACKTPSGVNTQCRYFLSDYDRDGVPNSSDNCDCHKNADQANCDGDSLGDACDSTDNSWRLISTSPATCHIDVDGHFFYDTMEMWGEKLYQSSCAFATCTKKYLLTSFNCFPDADMECCTEHWSAFDCGRAWNFDNCGVPRCTF